MYALFAWFLCVYVLIKCASLHFITLYYGGLLTCSFCVLIEFDIQPLCIACMLNRLPIYSCADWSSPRRLLCVNALQTLRTRFLVTKERRYALNCASLRVCNQNCGYDQLHQYHASMRATHSNPHAHMQVFMSFFLGVVCVLWLVRVFDCRLAIDAASSTRISVVSSALPARVKAHHYGRILAYSANQSLLFLRLFVRI